jgi:glycosyltransferase involved in cell wall biosynthesis
MRRTGLEALGLQAERIVHLPAGIDPAGAASVDRAAARMSLRKGRDWPKDAPVVGMLARYSPVKGYRDLVTAAGVLAGRRPDVRFFVAGPTGQTGRARVEAWVRQAGLEGHFATGDRLEDPLAAAAGFDIAVIASRGSEAVCRSALEYMTLGLPIVATRVHAIPETIGSTGVLVAPGAPEELAGAIDDLLGDAKRRSLLGEAAARRVREEFDSEKIARKAAEVLEETERERSAEWVR